MLRIFITNTRLRIASVLLLIWMTYLIADFSMQALFVPLFSTGIVVVLDLLLTYVRKRVLYLPASSIVTGLLIGLILSPTESLSTFFLAACLAVFSKHFIGRGMHRHVFNPAALGIFITSILLGVPVAWWAVSLHQWMILIIIGASYTLYRLKRLWLPFTFLLVYGAYLFMIFGQSAVVSALFNGTVFLFAFIMLTEPITSITTGNWRYVYGPLVAAFIIIIGKVGVAPDEFLPALLLGNLIGFLVRRRIVLPSSG